MKRKTIGKRTLATLLIVGFIVAAAFVVRNIADDVAERRAIADVERIGGVFERGAKSPNLPPWLAWAWPFKSTELHRVRLDGAQVTDAGLKDLVSIRQLKYLFLYRTRVTDVGLKDLATLRQLEKLELQDNQITDAGLKELAAFAHLKKLLIGSKITDSGLKGLASVTQLEELDLWNAHVTDAGVKELKKALPGCKIYVRAKSESRPMRRRPALHTEHH
jgi:hypothetical protein